MKKLLVALVVATLMLGWGYGGARQAHAAATVDFYIEVATAGCDTDAGPTTCDVPVGTQFTVGLILDSFSGLPGGGNVKAWEARLNNSASIPYQDRANQDEMGPSGSRFWPSCDIPADVTTNPNSYYAGCAPIISGPSAYTGKVMEVDYDCTAGPSTGHTVTLVHGSPTDTRITDENNNKVVDGDPDEVLTINCLASVGGTAEFPDGSEFPADASGSSSSSDYTVPIAAAVAGAVIALAVGGWYARRRWLG